MGMFITPGLFSISIFLLQPYSLVRVNLLISHAFISFTLSPSPCHFFSEMLLVTSENGIMAMFSLRDIARIQLILIVDETSKPVQNAVPQILKLLFQKYLSKYAAVVITPQRCWMVWRVIIHSSPLSFSPTSTPCMTFSSHTNVLNAAQQNLFSSPLVDHLPRRESVSVSLSLCPLLVLKSLLMYAEIERAHQHQINIRRNPERHPAGQ